MIRFIGKWLIDRAIERETPLPRWLRRRVDRDPELARFDAASRRLSTLLRYDAAEWMARYANDRGVERSTSAPDRAVQLRASSIRRRAAWTGAACAMAAGVLIAVAWWQGVGGDSPSPAASGSRELVAEQNTPSIATTDGTQLLALWEAGRANIGAWQARLKGAADDIEPLDLRDPAKILLTFPIANDTTRRVQEGFSAVLASQQHQLEADVKSAYAFFTYRLPTSVAILVGLQKG